METIPTRPPQLIRATLSRNLKVKRTMAAPATTPRDDGNRFFVVQSTGLDDQSLDAALNASFSADSVDSVAVDDSVLMSDMHASADYRAHLITQMTKRAVAACWIQTAEYQNNRQDGMPPCLFSCWSSQLDILIYIQPENLISLIKDFLPQTI